jgi:hypothetical protein
MEEDKLPYRTFEFAASLFALKFSHSSLEEFFCRELNRHPDDLSIPDLNRKDKFKWLLGKLPMQDQCRILERLCHTAGPPLRDADRDKLLQMLGGSPVRVPSPMQSRSIDIRSVSEMWHKALDRRTDDPDGAITAARTLLETVCKHILDELGE